MKDNYPVGTLVTHQHFTARKLGIVTEITDQYHPKMVVRWFHNMRSTYEHRNQVKPIEDTINDRT